ncbi:MAG: hypothetical protein Rubg2KO_40550 [Rubricoccaceae bacterium]
MRGIGPSAGLFSVARAVTPAANDERAFLLGSTVPYGVRTFLRLGNAKRATVRLTHTSKLDVRAGESWEESARRYAFPASSWKS